MVLWTLFLSVVALLTLLKLYQKLTCGICKSSAQMVGKVVIVTGGNSGLGFETAKDLANRGARVILACRNETLANTAIKEIVSETGNTDVYFKKLDFTSLRSVRQFCEDIIRTEKRLDVLVNNAAAGGLGNHKSADGIQIGMQVNYFAQFLLTCQLIPLLKSSAPSRIVSVSSIAHLCGKLDFDNVTMEKDWSDFMVYANTKLYFNLMTLELSVRLKGTGVTANCVHPGAAATNIFRNIPNRIIRGAVEKCINFFFKSPWEASQTIIYLAAAREVQDVSGKYFVDCCEAVPSHSSLDLSNAKKLWEVSEKIVKIK